MPGLAVAPEDEPLSLAPASGRGEPAIWVAKLAVYRAWPPSKDTLLRQVIELHRGLNILRAGTTGSTDEASRLAGHGAGQTTFCRLVRFVLGEEPAGSKGFREGFRAKFENGWVLAEVFVAGQRWLVARPLSQSGYHPFAKLNGSLADEFPDSPSRLGFRDYEAAIDAAVFGSMKFRTLADSQELLNWPRLLLWLSRDQEAHFSGLLEWRREQDSDSNSPYVSADDKANLIRLTLGLVDVEEQTLLAEFAGKTIVPELEYHGPRDSAALKVVRGLIFDLAALALGITNTAAHHPRFLIHDSPREADLAAAIYVSLFSAARELEEASGESPAFQYIVTTTEPPPKLLNQKPWVLDPVLDASNEAGRLLGVDL